MIKRSAEELSAITRPLKETLKKFWCQVSPAMLKITLESTIILRRIRDSSCGPQRARKLAIASCDKLSKAAEMSNLIAIKGSRYSWER